METGINLIYTLSSMFKAFEFFQNHGNHFKKEAENWYIFFQSAMAELINS